MSGGAWVALALLTPLALVGAAMVPGLWRPWLLPLAPLPALGLGLAGLSGLPVAAEAPGLLIGVRLAAEGPGLLLLSACAAVWAVAGAYAAATMPSGRETAGFTAFWGVTLAGNLAVFVAADVVGFYAAFAAVSLAAWGLVIHDRTEAALRAGRVYIAMAVLGEVCLLLGLMLGVQAAGSLEIAAVREVGAGGPAGVALLLLGLGIKAGLVPLHLWLPLAHPAAPVAASAVLSGAIVKAGVFGAVLLLGAEAAPGLMALGVAGGFAAAVYGLTQDNPKAVLAYSTVSQMGLTLAVLGAGLATGAGSAAAVVYAAHHALAKAALFLSAGAARGHRLGWAAAGLAALSVAGAPLTGGALVKAGAKDVLPGWVETALSASGVTTTLLLVWFLIRLRAAAPLSFDWPRSVALLALLPALAALAMPWGVAVWLPEMGGLAPSGALSVSALVAAGWPVAGGLVLAVGAAALGVRLPSLPPGDGLALLAPLAARLRRARLPASPDVAALRRRVADFAAAAGAAGVRAETGLLLWRWAGLLLLSLLLAMALAAG